MPDLHNHTVLIRTLSNGVTVVTVPMPGTAAVTAIVLFGVGSRYESDQQRGLAHFTEHMVFKGGKKYPSAQSVAQALDAVGGEFNAYTSQEFTGFYTKTAAPYLELGLDVLSDMLLQATFPAEELVKEKGVIVEEINMYEDMPMRKVDQVLSSLVFGDTPLGRPILGNKASVKSFTPDDFLGYREQFYKGSKCVVVVAGGVEAEQVEPLVERYFKGVPNGEPYQSATAHFINNGSRIYIEEKKSEQTHLMLAVKSYSLMDPKRYILRVLATILGGNMSSRLFTSVREKQGLCYYVRAMPDTYVDEGLLIANAGVDNSRLVQAVEAIMKEMQSLKDHPVEAEELERAKQYLLGKMLLSTEDSEQVAEMYGMQQLLEKEIRSLTEIRAAIQSVTAEEVLAAAKQMFTDEWTRLAVIGPHSDRQALDRLLHFS